jgi:hypothetical protein
MLEPLERIVLADEECVSRLDFAAKRAAREIEEAREAREASIAAIRKELFDAIDREIESIQAEGEARLREKRAELDRHLSRVSASAGERFHRAAETNRGFTRSSSRSRRRRGMRR